MMLIEIHRWKHSEGEISRRHQLQNAASPKFRTASNRIFALFEDEVGMEYLLGSPAPSNKAHAYKVTNQGVAIKVGDRQWLAAQKINE